MPRARTFHFFLAALLWLALPARADILVVVHPDSPLRQLTANEVANLYLGRLQSLNNGDPALVLDQPRDSSVRARFFKLLNGMDLRRVNAYWARLQFSGGTLPPIQLSGDQAILDVVRHDRLAIGYVDKSAVFTDLRVVLVLGER